MQITVKLYGTLRRFSLPDTPGLWIGEIPDGSTVRDLLHHFGTSEAELAAAAMDDQIISLDTSLESGNCLILVTPVGGGNNRFVNII